jgi:hypothetical protein
MSKPRTSFDITRDDMASLRALAASLGLFISRGPGAGELGNITQLLTRLAVAYRHDPEGTSVMLQRLFAAARDSTPPDHDD